MVVLARLFESLLLTSPSCGADMRIIAFLTDAAPIERILNHIGEPLRLPLARRPGQIRRSRCRTDTALG